MIGEFGVQHRFVFLHTVVVVELAFFFLGEASGAKIKNKKMSTSKKLTINIFFDANQSNL